MSARFFRLLDPEKADVDGNSENRRDTISAFNLVFLDAGLDSYLELGFAVTLQGVFHIEGKRLPAIFEQLESELGLFALFSRERGR